MSELTVGYVAQLLPSTHAADPGFADRVLSAKSPAATASVDAGVMELALRLDTSANWLLRGERPATPCVGAGDYLQAATLLRQQANEIERLAAALAAIDRHSVNTIRTNSKDRGDWAQDVAFIGKLARGH